MKVRTGFVSNSSSSSYVVAYSSRSTIGSRSVVGSRSYKPDTSVITGRPPDPAKFKILDHASINGWTALKVKYEEAQNYDGIKIMVFNEPIDSFVEVEVLDPHFYDKKTPDQRNRLENPFARFRPTEEGWHEALELIQKLGK